MSNSPYVTRANNFLKTSFLKCKEPITLEIDARTSKNTCKFMQLYVHLEYIEVPT